MATSLPMILRLSEADMARRSRPSKVILSALTVAVGGRRPMTASMATDLPEPDSPTMASTSRASTCRSMPLTALNTPTEVSKLTVRFLTSRRCIASAPLELGIERIAQAVADEVDRQHGDQDGKA